jgi:hypothetical protein
MSKLICLNCILKIVCSEPCVDFNSKLDRLIILAKAFQEQYSGYQGLNRDIIDYIKGDLIDMLRIDSRASADKDLQRLVHEFNEMYSQMCRIIDNKNRKGFEK